LELGFLRNWILIPRLPTSYIYVYIYIPRFSVTLYYLACIYPSNLHRFKSRIQLIFCCWSVRRLKTIILPSLFLGMELLYILVIILSTLFVFFFEKSHIKKDLSAQFVDDIVIAIQTVNMRQFLWSPSAQIKKQAQ
jgi:hypothetical protein